MSSFSRKGSPTCTVGRTPFTLEREHRTEQQRDTVVTLGTDRCEHRRVLVEVRRRGVGGEVVRLAEDRHQRVEVGADAAIAVGAQRLVADLLDRVVAGPRNRLGRRVAAVQRGVVMPQLERKTVGKAARLGHLFGRQVAPGQRHAKVLAVRRRGIRTPRHFNLCLARNRGR